MDSKDSSYSSGAEDSPSGSLTGGSLVIKASIISLIESTESSHLCAAEEIPCSSFAGTPCRKQSIVSRKDSKESSYSSGAEATPSGSSTAHLISTTSVVSRSNSKGSSHSSGTEDAPFSSFPEEQTEAGHAQRKEPAMWLGRGTRLTYHGNLLRKLRGRTDDKPFVCPKCERSFTQKEHLAFHARLHDGQRPFSCSECEKIYGGTTTVYSL